VVGKRFLFLMVSGVAFGFITGAYLPSFSKAFSFAGELFLNALKMVVLPLIMVSIANAVLNMETIENFKRLGVRAIAYYFFTTALAVATGIGVVSLFHPGAGFSMKPSVSFEREVSFSLHDLVVA